MIEQYIKNLIKNIKEDKMMDDQILGLYKIFKRHDLTDEEIEHAKTIKDRIKSGELTEESLIEKAKNWLKK